MAAAQMQNDHVKKTPHGDPPGDDYGDDEKAQSLLWVATILDPGSLA